MLHAKITSGLLLTIVLYLCWIPQEAISVARLSKHVQHHETLSYEADSVREQHHRSKRDASRHPFIHIQFHAHGRHFPLRLRRDTSVFHPQLVVEHNAHQLQDLDLSHIVSGTVWGDEGSSVFGSIRDGIFDGQISTSNGKYFVERANKYFQPHAASSTGFHSVIYAEKDILFPLHDHATGHGSIHSMFSTQGQPTGGCGGADREVREWMNSVQHSAVPSNHTEPDKEKKRRRSKRAASWKMACSLYIQTDPLLWEHIHVSENDETKTREEIASLIAQHVKAVNVIYESEDFGVHRGVKFLVQRITINDTKSCDSRAFEQPNPFCSRNIDVSNFLNLNSQMNHDAFCLAYVFTYRDFTGGTLGLAWVASPQGASGGICEKYKAYTENVMGRHIQTKRSLNTGIITFVNYHSRVPPKVSQLTLAHEIGHNFGSPHDWPQDCRPGGQTGNFIMFASATSGDRPNNSKFSTCSKSNITGVLNAVVQNKGGKENCFLEEHGPFCGNHIVEAGEECDCGYNEEECSEKCCYPFVISPRDKALNASAKPCTRKKFALCSPSEGPCCNSECQFEKQKLCRADSDCNNEALCNGHGAQCPTPVAKPNGTECNKNTQVCLKGECMGSICLKYNLEECFLSRAPGVSPEQLCEVACQMPGEPLTCRSTFHQQDRYGRNMSGIQLRPGSACDNFQGYCDVFQKCRAVDAEGPLARLKNILFNHKTLMTIAQWVTEYWWGVLLMGIVFVVVMAIFIKCCAVHTPSSNPKKPPARHIMDTLRRPAESLRRKRHRHHQTAPQSAGHAPPPYNNRSSGAAASGGRAVPQGHSSSSSSGHSRAQPQAESSSRGAGSSSGSGAKSGPHRGYGEGRGHYNRAKGGWMSDGYAAAYTGRQNIEMTSPLQNV